MPKQKQSSNNSNTPVASTASEKPKSIVQRTLILVKPDGVQRGLVGRIIQRFEDAGFKIVGSKMVWIDEKFGKKHYFDLAQRKGEKVLGNMLQFMTIGPVLALCLEGIDSVELVRKMVGSTEPKSAMPGTIRGDFAHHSYDYTDSNNKAIRNLIHASGNAEEAKYEIALWFKPEELHSYKTVHEIHVF